MDSGKIAVLFALSLFSCGQPNSKTDQVRTKKSQSELDQLTAQQTNSKQDRRLFHEPFSDQSNWHLVNDGGSVAINDGHLVLSASNMDVEEGRECNSASAELEITLTGITSRKIVIRQSVLAQGFGMGGVRFRAQLGSSLAESLVFSDGEEVSEMQLLVPRNETGPLLLKMHYYASGCAADGEYSFAQIDWLDVVEID